MPSESASEIEVEIIIIKMLTKFVLFIKNNQNCHSEDMRHDTTFNWNFFTGCIPSAYHLIHATSRHCRRCRHKWRCPDYQLPTGVTQPHLPFRWRRYELQERIRC